MELETMSACPACGESIDYCVGHGEMGDRHGAFVLLLHDDGDHGLCHVNSDCVWRPMTARQELAWHNGYFNPVNVRETENGVEWALSTSAGTRHSERA
jgi:hypothetical protein